MKNFPNLISTCLIILAFCFISHATFATCIDWDMESIDDPNLEHMAVVITCPGSITVACHSMVPPVDLTQVSALTNCGPENVFLISEVTTNMICQNRYTLVRTYGATDQCGGSDSCIQVITVSDNQAPIVTCPPNITVSCPNQVPPPCNACVTATDCSGSPVVVSFLGEVISNQLCVNKYTITRTFQVTDVCGNTATCTHTITVNDTTGPTITCPQDITVACASMVPPPNPASVISIDNCNGSPTVTHGGDVITNQLCPNHFTLNRTYYTIDACGNLSTCVQTITVDDNLALVLPPNGWSVVPCLIDAQVVPVPPVVVTVCGNQIIPVGPIVGPDPPCSGGKTYDWTYTDCAGNSLTWNYTYWVDTAYVVNFPADGGSTVPCVSDAQVAPVPPIVIDNCGFQVIPTGPVISADPPCAGVKTYEWTYMDCTGASTIWTYTYTISPPAFSAPSNTFASVTCLNNIVIPVLPLVLSYCGDVLVPVGPMVTPDPLCTGTKIYSWTYVDCYGNIATYDHIVTIGPNTTPPTIICPNNITVTCANQVPVPDPASATATDDCSIPTITHGGDVITNQVCQDQYTIVRSYIATDDCNNTAACTQLIVVFDNVAPVINCPPDVTVSCANMVPPHDINSVSVTENCGGPITVVFINDIISNQICVNRYTISRIYGVTDACGNQATCAQTITVFDNIPPTFNCPQSITVACASMVPPPGNYGEADNCSGAPTITTTDLTSNTLCANKYIIIRVITVTDLCGNTSTCHQSITVNDNIPPVITCPPNITTQCSNPTFAATAIDNCGGTVTISYSPASGSIFPQGTTSVTATATDACGNTSACTFTVTNYLGTLADYHMVFTNGSQDINWQGPTKGYIGDVAVDGIQAVEKTSGTVPYAGTIYTNHSTLGPWQNIVNANAAQASSSLNQTTLITSLETELENAFTLINALPVTPGYDGITPISLNNLNTVNGTAEQFVFNIKSGFTVTSKINITGDPEDVFILRWDTDKIFSNGYDGVVNFKSGGAIVPLGGLNASNFIHVAGDIKAGANGSNPPLPYPQGPRQNNGTGSLITGGSDFNGGGFYTGYWLTTGSPTTSGSGQRYGRTSSLMSAIFVGGWYTKSTKLVMTNGSSGVYVSACANQYTPLVTIPQIEIPTEEIHTHALILNAWPNPTNHEFTLEIEDGGDEVNLITVFDLLGAKVLQLENPGGRFIHLGEELNDGVYFINVRQGQKTSTIKMIKHGDMQ